MAAKQNTSPSQIDKTSFWYTGVCAVCHPGGGFTEFDRDGRKYFDVKTGLYGYETLGRTASEVALDGDYSEIVTSGASMGALRNPVGGHELWKRTGVAEADCLFCHRADRTVAEGKNMNWIWRSASLRGKDALVDGAGNPVAAYAAASTAAQGWFSLLELDPTVPAGQPPLAKKLEIDYQKGVDAGSLVQDADGALRIPATAIATTPTDYACWGCHITPEVRKRGRVWFDPRKDVHYARFNGLPDTSPPVDSVSMKSTACSRCHPGEGGVNGEHNIAKGGTTLGTVRDDTDYRGFRTCAECHTAGPDKDPEAPSPVSPIHTDFGHLDVLSCDACHIPHKSDAADMVVDNATTGSTIIYSTAKFLSEDPLNPAAPGDAKWWPDLKWKKDSDGASRLFPMKTLLSMWWGDWDTRGTVPTDDDVVVPLPLWRVRQAAKALPAGAMKDDTGDGTAEVNTVLEIQAWIAALKGNDSHGNRFARNPVLVKGGAIWYEQGTWVAHLETEGTGIKVESEHPFAADHNVLPAAAALGSAAAGGCAECHNTWSGQPKSRVFDRLILKDPFDPDGKPVYRTVKDRVGVTPP